MERNRTEYYKQYYQKNKARLNAKARAWQKNNPEKLYQYDVKRLYGLSKEELDTLNIECSICGSKDKLVVDHDHVTGKVRDKLCQPCNKGLGHFKDNIGIISSALLYLEKHNGT